MLALVALSVISSCSSDPRPGYSSPEPSPTPTGVANTAPRAGATGQVRFVIVTPPGSASVGLVAGSAPGGDPLASGLHAGTVTDYFASGPGGITAAASDGSAVSTFDVDHVDGLRYTVIIGGGDAGQFAADTLAEADGRVVDDAGRASARRPLSSGTGSRRRRPISSC